jgi:hypothetical protein
VVDPPPVRLGAHFDGGLAPAILAIVDRGVRLRPHMALDLTAEVELSSGGEYPPVRVLFQGPEGVIVEDGAAPRADLRVAGPLPDIVALLVTPLIGGVPSPIDARGRAALGRLAGRRVRVEGRLALMRRFLALIHV